MKTENTIENKAKFFAQYFGKTVLFIAGITEILENTNPSLAAKDAGSYIELRPLSSITGDEAIEVAKIKSWAWDLEDNQRAIKYGKEWAEYCVNGLPTGGFLGHKILPAYHYLQSLGFALPYHDLSVDDLIAYGWIKLV